MKKKNVIIYYSCSGNTERVSKILKEYLDDSTDIFAIELESPYTAFTAYTKGIFHTKIEYLPKIKNNIDLSSYDRVFLGSPIWAFTIPSPLKSFIKNNSLKGKIILPFCTNGGQIGEYFEKINRICKDAKILEGCSFSYIKKKSNDDLAKEIKKWLNKVLW